ncbi:conserved hypothetical protein [Candidatus Roizmanbacteria bacterium]|nr:conserved hypothetical protein [Candidatus Roizmanbacteria bacterium]
MPKLIPKEIIKQIKLLRQKGYSLPEIKKVVNVGHGSVFRYIQGVEILPEYRKIWHSKRGGSFKRMKLAEKKAEEKADEYIVRLSEKEKLIFLSALYWGEGSKGDFGLTNSDPDLIKVFVLGLKEVFKIRTDRLRISIRIYRDLDKDKCLKFWSKITEVPVSKFVSVNVLDGKKNGKLLYGMCRVRVTKGADVLKYIRALKNRVVGLF